MITIDNRDKCHFNNEAHEIEIETTKLKGTENFSSLSGCSSAFLAKTQWQYIVNYQKKGAFRWIENNNIDFVLISLNSLLLLFFLKKITSTLLLITVPTTFNFPIGGVNVADSIVAGLKENISKSWVFEYSPRSNDVGTNSSYKRKSTKKKSASKM